MVAFCFPSFCIDKDFEGKQKAKLELASASKNFPSFLIFLILKENRNNVKAILIDFNQMPSISYGASMRQR